ncbi:MAG: hypothetical protein M3477_04855, partial [Gemmatimonadota bacterium]|nr:hypothetical protein [Gemmatimonadota bacterium]
GKTLTGMAKKLSSESASRERRLLYDIRSRVSRFSTAPIEAARVTRAEHLDRVCRRLGAKATLQVVEGADHSFDVLKLSGRTESDVMEEPARTIAVCGRAPIDRDREF